MEVSAFEDITAAPENGSKGDTGDPGPMFYPAGKWERFTTYERTKELCPFVLYDTGNPQTDLYYYPKTEGVISGSSENKTPNLDPKWKAMNYFEVVQTKMLFARMGLLGSAVFYDDYMFSQHGIDESGNSTTDYSGFPNSFTPNLKLNLRTGELYGRNVNLEGSLKKQLIIHRDNEENYRLVTNKNNDYVICSDRQETFIYLSTGIDPRYYGMDINIYNGTPGRLVIMHILEANLFLWRGQQFNQIRLQLPGQSLSLKYAPVSSEIPYYGGMFYILNESNFTKSIVEDEQLISRV